LREKNGKLSLEPAAASTRRISAKEASVAFWAFEHKKPAGRYTDTLPLAAATYYPLISTGGIVGVLGLRLPGKRKLTPDQEEILFAFVNHAAITIERDFLASERRRLRVAEESEKLHEAILNSISHELRTPIAVILGAISTMQLKSTENNGGVQSALMHEVDIAARKLNVLVSNLLDMSRIEANKISLIRQSHDLRNIIGEVTERLRSDLEGNTVTTDFHGDDFCCDCDNTLLQQALMNIVVNSAFHNQKGIKISVSCSSLPPDKLTIVVSDNGVGIPPEIIDSVFDKFFRSPTAVTGGTGLGLPIAKAIVELHGGSITASNLPTGGACFTLTLPKRQPAGAK
jgi:two-component system sensor histidine kinase KdpD